MAKETVELEFVLGTGKEPDATGDTSAKAEGHADDLLNARQNFRGKHGKAQPPAPGFSGTRQGGKGMERSRIALAETAGLASIALDYQQHREIIGLQIQAVADQTAADLAGSLAAQDVAGGVGAEAAAARAAAAAIPAQARRALPSGIGTSTPSENRLARPGRAVPATFARTVGRSTSAAVEAASARIAAAAAAGEASRAAAAVAAIPLASAGAQAQAATAPAPAPQAPAAGGKAGAGGAAVAGGAAALKVAAGGKSLARTVGRRALTRFVGPLLRYAGVASGLGVAFTSLTGAAQEMADEARDGAGPTTAFGQAVNVADSVGRNVGRGIVQTLDSVIGGGVSLGVSLFSPRTANEIDDWRARHFSNVLESRHQQRQIERAIEQTLIKQEGDARAARQLRFYQMGLPQELRREAELLDRQIWNERNPLAARRDAAEADIRNVSR